MSFIRHDISIVRLKYSPAVGTVTVVFLDSVKPAGEISPHFIRVERSGVGGITDGDALLSESESSGSTNNGLPPGL